MQPLAISPGLSWETPPCAHGMAKSQGPFRPRNAHAPLGRCSAGSHRDPVNSRLPKRRSRQRPSGRQDLPRLTHTHHTQRAVEYRKTYVSTATTYPGLRPSTLFLHRNLRRGPGKSCMRFAVTPQCAQTRVYGTEKPSTDIFRHFIGLPLFARTS